MDSICEKRYDYSPIIKLEHSINQDDVILYIFIGKNKKLKTLLDNINFDTKSPFETKISKNYTSELSEILGDKFLSILFNPDKKYKSIHFIDKHLHMDDTIINIKKENFTYSQNTCIKIKYLVQYITRSY